MDWVTIAALILQYGLPFVEKLIANWTNKTPVTPAEWAVLVALGQNTALSQMKAALTRAGIPLDDPRAIAILSQIPA